MARHCVKWARGKRKGTRVVYSRRGRVEGRSARKAYNVYCGAGKGRKMGPPNFAYPSITGARAALRRISKNHAKCRVKQVRR
jgi:hypothetical protein